jgi:hypothetical protein
MPLRHWAKLTMGVQALISLVVLGLIITRAVNILNLTPPLPRLVSAQLGVES